MEELGGTFLIPYFNTGFGVYLHLLNFVTLTLIIFLAQAGFTSARLYKFFGGLRWKTNILMTGLFVPGLVMSVFLIINMVLLVLNSSAAVSFTAILSVLAMWLLVSLPLSLIGAFFGFRKSVSLQLITLSMHQDRHGFVGHSVCKITFH